MLLTLDFASFVLVILLYSSLAFIYIYIYILSYIYCTNQIAAAFLLVQFTPVEKFLGDFTITIV